MCHVKDEIMAILCSVALTTSYTGYTLGSVKATADTKSKNAWAELSHIEPLAEMKLVWMVRYNAGTIKAQACKLNCKLLEHWGGAELPWASFLV